MSVLGKVARVPGAPLVRHALGLDPLSQPNPADYEAPILNRTEGGELIRALVEAAEPVLVDRLGWVEVACCMHFLRHRCGGLLLPYRKWLRDSGRTNAGIFPNRNQGIDAFVRVFLEAATESDVVGVWFRPGENFITNGFCPGARLVPLESIEPDYRGVPWTTALRGRRVLVIHPFADTIRCQYETKRELLFENPEVLPQFDLIVLKAVQSFAGESSTYSTWSEALDRMKAEMDATSYDVCIVGAGAYGLPLAAHAKASGKVGVHMGGVTQLLFGIKGRRWDELESVRRLYNDAWVRPAPSEMPRDWLAVEEGCYW